MAPACTHAQKITTKTVLEQPTKWKIPDRIFHNDCVSWRPHYGSDLVFTHQGINTWFLAVLCGAWHLGFGSISSDYRCCNLGTMVKLVTACTMDWFGILGFLEPRQAHDMFDPQGIPKKLLWHGKVQCSYGRPLALGGIPLKGFTWVGCVWSECQNPKNSNRTLQVSEVLMLWMNGLHVYIQEFKL